MNELAKKIQAILFWKAEPVSLKKLADFTKTDAGQVKEAVAILREALRNSGLAVVETDDEVMLGTAKDLSPIIEELSKEELTRDLGKAGLETLSIVLYQGPISRADIDYIRGVNSQFILRNLLIRGLVERVDNPKDQRSFLYKPTIALLSHLGVSNIRDLPDYEKVREDIDSYRKSAAAEDKNGETTE